MKKHNIFNWEFGDFWIETSGKLYYGFLYLSASQARDLLSKMLVIDQVMNYYNSIAFRKQSSSCL